jgi:hypothetical protein
VFSTKIWQTPFVVWRVVGSKVNIEPLMQNWRYWTRCVSSAAWVLRAGTESAKGQQGPSTVGNTTLDDPPIPTG